MAESSSAAEDLSQFKGVVERWDAELRAYEKATKKWCTMGQEVVDRYALTKVKTEPEFDITTRFNILWSNIQTQSPALFSRAPVPAVERRHKDRDRVARMSATILERCIATDLEFDEIDHCMKQATLDYQLPGRGVLWVRYDRKTHDEEIAVSRSEDGVFVSDAGAVIERTRETEAGIRGIDTFTDAERAPVDYIHWRDFAHKPVKSWKELKERGWVGKRTRMTRAEGVRMFGDVFKRVPLRNRPKGMEDWKEEEVPSILKEAEIWEIWNAEDRRVYQFSRDWKEQPLRVLQDPLQLECFFPVPRPILTTLSNDTLIPVPDYWQWRNLADELDEQTEKISIITKKIHVRGGYDASVNGLATLLDDHGSAMVPIPNMASLFAKGSVRQFEGVIQWLPIDMMVQVLLSLYDARDRTRALIDEISGTADILRGQVDPREKLGQSRIKGQFATLRLDDRQKEIARLARDAIRIKAEIIAEHFEDATLREMSGYDTLPEVQALQELGEREQLFAQAVELIRDDRMRGFRVDIETDSTVALDEQQEKETRVEFLTAVGSFLERAVPIAQTNPQLAPLMAELLLFGVRAFKAGRAVEGIFESAIDELKVASEQPQQEGPSPEELQRQADQQKAQQEAQMQQQAMALEQQSKMLEIQTKREEAQAEREIRIAEAASDRELELIKLMNQVAAQQQPETVRQLQESVQVIAQAVAELRQQGGAPADTA